MLNKEKNILFRFIDAINPYFWITWLRNMAFDHKIIKSHTFDIATISIGNITVGGTGKTPHTEYIAKLLKDKHNTVVLSRGYGRKSKGYIKADENTPMQIIGDEPAQIKNKFPDIDVCVCEKRAIGIKSIMAENKDIEVILLDDAYQHRHVKAGLSILLIDNNRPLWQDCILPFGRMRESIQGIKRADIVIITKCNEITDKEHDWCKEYIKSIKDIPVFFTAIRYGTPYRMSDRKPLEEIKGERLLVTGIANPSPLKEELEKSGATTYMKQYSDHHNFTTHDIKEITAAYNNLNTNGIIITTEKDAVRLLQHTALPKEIKDVIYVMPIEVAFLYNEEKMFNQIIENYVTENSRNS